MIVNPNKFCIISTTSFWQGGSGHLDDDSGGGGVKAAHECLHSGSLVVPTGVTMPTVALINL